ncbi:NTP transferase domain-containing protein [uncultured Maribacter sp.]|uniref:NTP transferase domain-containing protein n=1 Tax=uncultured Maribacter sp. TaxID=431308 RepID=UPI0026335187|nr:NTP transferase domain-containing protein [uncultured Maribacter sp.]
MISKDKIYGLVLSGGKSTRMGEDKGLITYHKLPQREHLYHLLNEVCDKTFLSIRKDQKCEISNSFDVIIDNDEFRGPYNGLLSAHKAHPDAAWLVLACDLPLMDKKALEELIEARNSDKIASAFADADDPLPEPLCAIWEPEALKQSVAYLEVGNGSCPRKFLINSDVNLVFPQKKEVLLNANSRAEYEEALLKIAP